MNKAPDVPLGLKKWNLCRALPFFAPFAGALAMAGATYAQESSHIAPIVPAISQPFLFESLLNPLKATERSAEPMRYVGVNANEILTDDREEALRIAKDIKEAGFNSLRVFLHWTWPRQSEQLNNREAICNMAYAAENQGLHTFITFDFVNSKGEFGHPPENSTQLTWFNKTLGDTLYIIKNKDCAPSTEGIHVEPDNEANLSTFRPQYDAKGNWVAPSKETILLQRVYPFLKRKGRELDIDVSVAATLSSSNNPVGFINAMGVSNGSNRARLMDEVAFHPYDDGDLSIENQLRLEQAAINNFGSHISMVDTEVGYETIEKPYLKPRYTGITPKGVRSYTEQAQGDKYAEAIRVTACQGIDTFFVFHFKDTFNRGDLQSGVKRPDGTDKASKIIVKNAAQAALSGKLEC